MIVFGQYAWTLPRSAIGNMLDYRCLFDSRSMGREFDPGSVRLYNNFYGPLIHSRRVLVSNKCKYAHEVQVLAGDASLEG